MKGATRVLTAEFDYDLPAELIAQHPCEQREQARLMLVDRATSQIAHHRFADLPTLLNGPDILARNNTQVLPARLCGHREATGGKWEGLFLRELDDQAWEVMATTRGCPSPG
jgi:S-adenosylmethionine:tRNA ribosyltransferase-isomerase